MEKQAVFLVGGKGTRLGSLTQDVPKPLLEIAPGTRFLDVIIDEAARHGFTDIILLAGYLGDQVEAAYADRNFRNASVRVLRETEPQGTGGALRLAQDILAPTFLMGNGDSLFDINLGALSVPLPASAEGRIALREVPDPARYGAVTLTDGRITQFLEKRADLPGPALINGGLYFFNRSILDRIDGPCSIEADILPKMSGEGVLLGEAFEGYFLDIGLPETYDIAKLEIAGRKRACAFLDRDGVLNADKGYTHKPDDLDWIEGAKSAIRKFNDLGMLVIVVTNQAGVARGFYGEADVDLFHQRMARDLADVGAHVDAFYYCPFHADGVVPEFTIDNHPDRKPNSGMLMRAMQEWPVDPDRSFLIGDKSSDVEAAHGAGVKGFLFEGETPLETFAEHVLTLMTR